MPNPDVLGSAYNTHLRKTLSAGWGQRGMWMEQGLCVCACVCVYVCVRACIRGCPEKPRTYHRLRSPHC